MYGKDHVMYDLHHYSEGQAAALVCHVIRETSAASTVCVRFITGRGNHINSKGERGTLFNQFPEWLKQSPFADRIEKVEAFDGHYVVYIKPTLLDSDFAMQTAQKYSAEELASIRTAAVKGDPEAMVLYARLLESGKHIEPNVKEAVGYFRRAAEAECSAGMHEYARCWLHGIGVRQSDAKAKVWLKKASDRGYILSTLTLAKKYAGGAIGYTRDMREAIRLFDICAKAGEAEAMRNLGYIFQSGLEVEKCDVTSFYWYKRAADLCDAKAAFNVAVKYKDGQGTARNLEESIRYFKLAAYFGDVDAQYMHAINLFRVGDKKSREQGEMWLFVAADNGSEAANERLSHLLPPEESRKYLARSADAGNFLSQMRLNALDGKPADFGVSFDKMVATYRVLSQNDLMHMSVEAKYFLLDKMLLEGKAEDKRSAFDTIKDMAAQQCAYAMRRVAYFYERGDGVLEIKKNPQHVLDLLEKAAALKDPISIVQWGNHCLKSKKDPERIQLAKQLFRDAAVRKYPPAFYALGLMYQDGFFGDDKAQDAIKCFRSAVKYEKMDGHVKKFAMSSLDEYESIADKALACIDQLLKSGRVSLDKPRRVASSTGMTAGFFSAPKDGPTSKQKNSMTAPSSSRTETHEPAQKLPRSPKLSSEIALSKPPPVQITPQRATQSGWSFFSASTVLIVASVVTLTMMALR